MTELARFVVLIPIQKVVMDDELEEKTGVLAKSNCLNVSRHGRERLERLYRRRDWLAKRVGETNKQGKDYAYDKAELSALTWATQYIEDGDTVYYLLAQWMADVLKQNENKI